MTPRHTCVKGSPKVLEILALGPGPQMIDDRRGRLTFPNATLTCFAETVAGQSWTPAGTGDAPTFAQCVSVPLEINIPI